MLAISSDVENCKKMMTNLSFYTRNLQFCQFQVKCTNASLNSGVCEAIISVSRSLYKLANWSVFMWRKRDYISKRYWEMEGSETLRLACNVRVCAVCRFNFFWKSGSGCIYQSLTAWFRQCCPTRQIPGRTSIGWSAASMFANQVQARTAFRSRGNVVFLVALFIYDPSHVHWKSSASTGQ